MAVGPMPRPLSCGHPRLPRRALHPRHRVSSGPCSVPVVAQGARWSAVRSPLGCDGLPYPGQMGPWVAIWRATLVARRVCSALVRPGRVWVGQRLAVVRRPHTRQGLMATCAA